MITFSDASDYVFNTIAHDAAGDALLTVTLTRFAIYCANHPRYRRMLDTFVGEFYAERLRLNHLAMSAKVERNEIRRVGAMVKR